MKNKKGAEKILSVYWFAILVIITGAIVAMVSLFYGAPYDIREMESNIMINQISDCLSKNGKLNSALISNQNFNETFSIEDDCDITFETELEKEQYYVEVNFTNLNSLGNSFKISGGIPNLLGNCEIADKEKKSERLAKCVDRDFYALDELDNVYLINVLSIIRKTRKNVK